MTAPAVTVADRQTGTVHRDHLDGMRTLAVYLVIAFHSGIDRLDGGFIGVDVFFVLSGYLVTQVMMRDLRGNGRIGLWRFYSRRIRRLLPAAAFALIGTAIVFSYVAGVTAVNQTRGDFSAAFLYFANWHFLQQSTNYFGEQINASPVLHFWSLAVEEQFYFVWPLTLVAIVAIGRRWRQGTDVRKFARIVVVLLGALSLAAALLLRTDQPNRAYFGTDTRAYQLLAGVALALSPGLIKQVATRQTWARLLAVGGAVGLVAVASSVTGLDAILRGVLATIATLALLVGIESAPEGRTARFFAWRPIAYLGTISYGTYLWHWPVIIVSLLLIKLSSHQTLMVAAVVGTALAALSSELVERPIRRSPVLDRIPVPTVVVGLAMSVLLGVMVIPRITHPQTADRQVAADDSGRPAGQATTPVPAGFDAAKLLDQGYGQQKGCLGTVDNCVVRRGSGLSVLLIGDSNATMMLSTFSAIAEKEDWTFSVSTTGGCPWQPGFFRDKKERLLENKCPERQQFMLDTLLPQMKVDLVIAVNSRFVVHFANPDFIDLPDQIDERDKTIAAVKTLTEDGRRLVVMSPVPRPPPGFAPLDCLARASYAEQCNFKAPVIPDWSDKLIAQLDQENPNLFTFSVADTICPRNPNCDAVLHDTPVWWDEAHLTVPFQPQLVEPVLDQFRLLGLVPLPK